MKIVKIIDGIEREIELSREEMSNIAYELDVVNLSESVKEFLKEFETECYDDFVRVQYEKYRKLVDGETIAFHRNCAEGIISLADERCISLSDDLTEIFDEVIVEELNNFKREE